MTTTQKQSKEDQKKANLPENQGKQSRDSGSKYSGQDDRGDSEDDKRTGTSISGNTAPDSFNTTAEQQQTD